MIRYATGGNVPAPSKWSRPAREARRRLTDDEPVRRDPEQLLDAIEARARAHTGRPHFGCIPAWAWRAAIADELEGQPR